MARIGIDYTAAVRQAAGIGRYVRELIGALLQLDRTNEYRLFAASPSPLPEPLFSAAVAGGGDRRYPEGDTGEPAASRDRRHSPGQQERFREQAGAGQGQRMTGHPRVVRLPFHDKWLMRVWYRARLPLPVELVTGRIDLFHSPDFTLPPTLPGTLTLLTIHDLSFVREPDTADPRLGEFLRQVVPRSVRRAHHVLADSEATKRDLTALWDTPRDKITVVHCGVDAHFRPVTDTNTLTHVRARYGLGDERFILSIGTLHPRKNYRRLIQAFAPLAARDPNLSLVIAGGKGWAYDEILSEPRRLGIAQRVRFIGFVIDSDLPALYSAAAIFAYPSLYEGFGMPILEAMACGTPVIASDRSSLPEVTGDAGLQADPLDVEGWAAGMERLLNDGALRSDLIARGRAQARRFTWEAAARRLLETYERLMRSKHPVSSPR